MKVFTNKLHTHMTHIIDPKHNRRELQIMTGAILGGSSIVKPTRGRNCYLSMRSKDSQWLKWKAKELEGFASVDPFTEDRNGTLRWHSLCYPLFNEFRDKFYKDGKRHLQLENFEELTDIALMTWWCDSGKFKDGRVVLNTHIWGEEGTNIAVEYLGLACWDAEVYKERKSFRTRLSEDSSKHFLKMVGPLMPHFMAMRPSPSEIPK